jgi:predicted O-methyltransferase YrrM
MREEILRYGRERHIPVMRDKSAEELIKRVRENSPADILEIGTAIGYSGILMLQSAPKAKLTTVEINEERAETAKGNFLKAGLSDRIKLLIGDAVEIIPCIRETFDFILLDGPKGHYLEMLPYLVKMLRKGGILFADDVMYLGLIEDKDYSGRKHRTIVNNMRGFIDAVIAEKSLETEIIRIEDGILISKKI